MCDYLRQHAHHDNIALPTLYCHCRSQDAVELCLMASVPFEVAILLVGNEERFDLGIVLGEVIGQKQRRGLDVRFPRSWAGLRCQFSGTPTKIIEFEQRGRPEIYPECPAARNMDPRSASKND